MMRAAELLELPTIRQAIQSAVGTAGAIAAGSVLSGQRWYWAVIAAFVVAIGIGSRGEAVVKALQRVAGTVLGVAVGIALATAVDGHKNLAMGLTLMCLFLAYYAFQTAYATMIFFITVMLALLYGLLGQFKPELLLRVEETAVGAAVGTAAVFFVLPTRQNEAFKQALDGYLDALSGVFAAARDRGDTTRAVADLQARTQDLRNAHGPTKRGWGGFVAPRYRNAIHAAMRCTYLVREWMLIEHPREPEAATRPWIERLIGDVASLKEGKEPESASGRPSGAPPASVAVGLLEELDDAVERLRADAAPLLRKTGELRG